MSKKATQSNTLFNYFSSPKTPATPKAKAETAVTSNSKNNTSTIKQEKRAVHAKDDGKLMSFLIID